MIAKAKCEKCKQMIRFDEVLTHKCEDHVPDHLRNIPADRLKTLKAIQVVTKENLKFTAEKILIV